MVTIKKGDIMVSKVYFSKEITPENLIKMYDALNVELPGKVAVKLHSGEKGNQNYIKPEFVQAIVKKLMEQLLNVIQLMMVLEIQPKNT